ncbi:MAG: LD-carboxypeptidase [Pirellulales bacterium]
MQITRPKSLRRGDTISVIAPAGPVVRERLEKAFAFLTSRGYRIKTHGDVFRKTGYLAGDDSTRAGELMAAFADPESRAVWCARGGYGVARLLGRLDYDLIQRHPKVFVGFSDITGLHLAFQNRASLVTFHGPNLQDGFGAAEPMSETTEAALWRTIAPDGELDTGMQLATYAEDGVADVRLRAIVPGIANGRLTGGNLSVLAGLIGTPYDVETEGRILFLEDVNEPVYRVDRYLAQLSLAGKLRAAAGVLLGSFNFDEGEPSESADAMNAILNEYFGQLEVPVLAGLPAGHQKENWALPISGLVEVNANARRVTLVENPVVG